MAKTKISQFDATAANNTDLNSISIAEGTAPSNINNAIRELMSQLADLNLGNEVLSTLKIDNLHLDGNTIVTLDTNGDLNLTPNGTGAVTIAKADINGGAIDGTPIGASSASTGAFSTLSASSTANLGSTVTISGGNIDGVIGANTPAAITGTVITANTNFAGDITGNVTGNVTGNLTGNVTGNVTGDVTGDVTGNITASSGTSTFNNVTINGTLDMDSTTSQTITGLATPSGSTDAATKGYVDTEVSALVDSAPATLDTLNELAAALGDDASFSTTVTNSIAAKLPLAGGTMTGDINLDSNSLTNLAAPSGVNDATTKTYVDTADALKLNLSGGTMSGDINADSNKVTNLATPTATGDATSKSYVDGILGSATSAATSASAAATSATSAATSATSSENSSISSAASAASAAASYDNFDDRYLGAKSSAPTVDNDGDALVTGALYFNTTSDQLFIWNGSAWTQAAFTASGFLSGSNNLSDVDSASTSRTNLGLAIGTNVQAHDADLDALAGLTSAADKGIQFTGSGTAGTYDLTSAGKALLDDADAAAQRTTLGLGTAATTASTDYATAAQGTKADNAAAKASNLSDLASASTARTNLGLGTAATLTAGTSANNAVQLDSNAKLPAVDGSQLTGISSGSVAFTADGAVSAAGKPVSLTTEGKVKEIVATVSRTNGSAITFVDEHGVRTGYNRYPQQVTVHDDATNKNLIVYIKNDNKLYGKVYEVHTNNYINNFGSEVLIDSSTSMKYYTVGYDSNTNRCLVVYGDVGNSEYLTAVVGTIDASDNSVSFGTATVLSINFKGGNLSFDTNVNQFLLQFVDGSGKGRSIPVTVTGGSTNTVTFGNSGTAYQPSGTDNIQTMSIGEASCFFPNRNKVAMFWINSSQSSRVYAQSGTISGSGSSATVSYSSFSQLDSTSSQNRIAIHYHPQSERGFMTYMNDGQDDRLEGRMVAMDSSGNLSFTASVDITTSQGKFPTSIVDESTGSALCFYRDETNYTYPSYDARIKGREITLPATGDTITVGSPFDVDTGHNNSTYTESIPYYLTCNYDSTAERVVLFYDYSGSTNVGVSNVDGKFKSKTFRTTSPSTEEEFVGIAQSAVSDGASVDVKLLGAVDENQSGLTIGLRYYLDEATYTTTSSGHTEIGKALAADKLLITN